MNAKPFVKWAGGKSRLLPEIRRKYPFGIEREITRYCEPFVGGGAVLFDVLNRYSLDEIYISDINRELINAYRIIRDNSDGLIEILKKLETEYYDAHEEAKKEIFYSNRRRFNDLKTTGTDNTEIASLFIFLNKTCFNGLFRVNARGLFNVPQGSYKKPCICDEENLRAVSEKLQGVIIECADYRQSGGFVDKNTFVYFDPPYRPLTETSNFTAYSSGGFNDDEQAALARFIDETSERGAYILASNSDPKNINENDDFFDKLYAKHEIFRVESVRAINSIGTGRGRIRELLIVNG
ncbi:MAG: DNA adenine methylase [Oscillospiraceae bacterium]|jgi:DNA adenine methylase|nr:DNA adenine methylase [Oscillospiraceae bacterium]